MKRILFALCLLHSTFTHAAPGEKQVNVAALITHESHVLTTDGITKDVRYQERFYRQGSQVWIERVLPENTKPEPDPHAHGEHDHFNFNIAARHIMRGAKGQTKIALINRRDKLIVSVNKEEQETVGFNGSWEGAYYILDPAMMKTLPASNRPSNTVNARWYEKDNGREFFRVLWAEDLDLPLLIESGNKEGAIYDKISVTLLPFPPPVMLPWAQLGQYTHKDYMDFLD